MIDNHHAIDMAAPPAKIYEAITSAASLRAWWTPDAAAEATVGSVAEFGFFNRAVVFRMKVAELVPDARVVWECIGGPDDWPGTRLTWEISPADKGARLRFTHGGWPSTAGHCATSNTTWGALMHHLRSYVEGKARGPYFS
jgi:uncharacterized protein YndB with AHSA1/START domain